MKKKKKQTGQMHQRKVDKMIKSAEESGGLLQKSRSQRCGGEEYKVPLDVTKETRRNCGILGEGGTEWQMAATSLHDDVLLDESETDCNDADVDSLVASP